jgi:hypothetical protein
LRRLAENTEHGDAIAADLGIEVGQPVDRFIVDAAVIVERRRRDRKRAFGLGGEFCHRCLFLSLLSFRDGPKDQTRNLEIPGSMLCIAPE